MVPEFDVATSYQQIEAEVLELFNKSDIVTPDEVRGNYSTLAEAVLTDSRYGCACMASAGTASVYLLVLPVSCVQCNLGVCQGSLALEVLVSLQLHRYAHDMSIL